MTPAEIDHIWSEWATTTTTTPYSTTWNNWVELDRPRQLSRRERARQAEEARRRQQGAVERQIQAARQRAVAADKAEALLREYLNPAQRESWDAEWRFVVVAASGRRYLINDGLQGNVASLNANDEPVIRYCGHIASTFPLADNVLAQKLLIETDEDEFVRLSNASRVGRYEIDAELAAELAEVAA